MQICFVVEICSKTCRVLQKRISICSCMIGPAISIYVTLKSDEYPNLCLMYTTFDISQAQRKSLTMKITLAIDETNFISNRET